MNDYYFEPSWKRRKRCNRLTAMLLGVFICMTIAAYSCSSKEEKVEFKTTCVSAHEPNAMPASITGRYLKLVSYFKKHNNPHPEMSASAVIETRKTKLMASVAVKGEKNSPYTSKKGGYKKRHKGMFQVNEKDWGFAGNTPIDQALKSEQVLDEFIVSYGGSLQKGLNGYGGDKTRKVYAKNILNELQNIP